MVRLETHLDAVTAGSLECVEDTDPTGVTTRVDVEAGARDVNRATISSMSSATTRVLVSKCASKSTPPHSHGLGGPVRTSQEELVALSTR